MMQKGCDAQLRASTADGDQEPMDNLHLFALINAGPGLGSLRLGAAIGLAQWLIYGLPLAMAIAWVRGDRIARRDLLQMLLATLIALGVGQIVAHLWPLPRPVALHLGSQYLEHSNDPGMPSDHVTVFWSLGLAAFGTRRFGVWGRPLLAMGLVVGWSRVFLGVHFPFDVLAALPVASMGAIGSHVLQRPTMPFVVRLLDLYDRVSQLGKVRLRAARKAWARRA